MAALLTAASVSAVAQNAFVGLRGQVSATRESVVALLSNENWTRPEFQKALRERTDAVSERLAALEAPAGKTAQFKELTEVWRDYVKTYEKEFVVAVEGADVYGARRLVGTVQGQRMTRLQQLLQDLASQP